MFKSIECVTVQHKDWSWTCRTTQKVRHDSVEFLSQLWRDHEELIHKVSWLATPVQSASFRFSERLCLKNQERSFEDSNQDSALAATCLHSHLRVHTYLNSTAHSVNNKSHGTRCKTIY